jgi:hypothetical protein
MSGEVGGGGGGGGGGQMWRNQSSPVRANFQQHTREGLAGTPSEGIQPSSGSSKPQVKYGVRSPEFIWAPCAQLFSLAVKKTQNLI